jgi:dipeptidase E
MKLVFYSGGQRDENQNIDIELFHLIESTDPLFTFIPACYDDSNVYYSEFIQHFSFYGVRKFNIFPIDTPFDYVTALKVLESDVIYLGGGNTFYFLKNLKRSGFLHLLKEYVAAGGVLAGMSAGAIIMTNNISTASFPVFDADDNEVALTNLKAMSLVSFEFYPHFTNTRRYIHELNLESYKRNHPIYACGDGSGIVVNDNKIMMIGDVWSFFRGKKYKLT